MSFIDWSSVDSKEYPQIYENALKILAKRYFRKDDNGNVVENIDGMFKRVAEFVAGAEDKFGRPELKQDMAVKFYDLMRSLRFVPNTPTLINAGRKYGQLAACYVLPTEDSMGGIMDTLKAQALVQKSGGGTGFSFSCIRERGAVVSTTGMQAAGPIPVIKLMNYLMSEFVSQGGARNGANMAVLDVDHNDIEEFITFKEKDGSCASFNVSVSATDAFMEAVEKDGSFETRSRTTGKVLREIKARELFQLIVTQAWRTGDPGLLFIDEINRFNPTPKLGRLEATNPCGEQSLLPNEACTLGHMNLGKYFKPGVDATSWEFKFDWEQYGKDIDLGVRFLDNVIEVNYYVLDAIETMHRKNNRKIGLGVMGLADLLILLDIPYSSPAAIDVSTKLARFHCQKADEASMWLAKERGSFGSFEGSLPQKNGWSAMRNACRTTVAPTGTTAIIANTSTGIEPIYALFMKRIQAGMEMYETHQLFNTKLDTMLPSVVAQIVEHYDRHGTIQNCNLVSDEIKQLFMTANEIDYKQHIGMQAAWQQFIDNAISKTINMPNSATMDDVGNAYMLAWKSKCKGITVYRDGCRANQALNTGSAQMTFSFIEKVDTCPECHAQMEINGGCETCKSCGYAVCKI